MDTVRSDALRLFGLTLTDTQCAALDTYASLLLERNRSVNLTAIRDPEGVRVRHFLDSMSLTLAWRDASPPRTLIDVGTGAGFPGIVLKVLYPDTDVTLVESVGKKVSFCRDVISVLGLTGIRVIPQRAEVLAHDPQYRQQYEVAAARAVAPLPVLSEYLLPFAAVGGLMVAPKGSTAGDELTRATRAIRILGGRPLPLIPLLLPGDTSERNIAVIRKVTPTPPDYPRDAGIPSSQPLI